MKAYKFQFDLLIERVSVAISFPCTVQVFWKRGSRKISTQNRSQLCIEKGAAEINETLSMLTTIYQNENGSILPKKSSLTVVVQTTMGNKIAGDTLLNLNEFLPANFSNLASLKLGKHQVSQALQLRKCPDQNAQIIVKVTSQFVSECFDNETMSVGSCGSRLTADGDLLVDLSIQSNVQVPQQMVEQNNFTFSLNNARSEPVLKNRTAGSAAFMQYDTMSKVPSKEQIEDSIRNKKRLQQMSVQDHFKKDRENEGDNANCVGTEDKQGEINKLKYENERLKKELFRSKFKNDDDLLATVTGIQNENSQMKAAVKETNEEIQKKEMEIKQLMNEVIQLRDKNTEVIEQKRQYEGELSKCKSLVEQLEGQLKSIQKELMNEVTDKGILLNKLKKERDDALTEKDKYRMILAEKFQENEYQTQHLQKVGDENKELKGEKQRILEQLETSRKNYESLQKEREGEQKEYARQNALWSQKLENLVNSNKSTNDQYEETKQLLADRVENLSKKCEVLAIKVVESEEQSEKQQSHAKLREAEIEKLREEIKKSVIQNEELKSIYQQSLSQMRNEQIKELQKKDELIEENLEAIQFMNELEEQKNQLDEKVLEFQNLVRRLDEEKQILEEQIQSQKDNNATLHLEIQAEKTKNQESLDQIEQRIILMQEEFSIQKGELQSVIEAQIEEIELRKAEISSLEANVSKQLKEINNLKRKNDKLEDENTKLSLTIMNDLTSIVKKQDNFSKEYTRMAAERSRLNHSVSSNY